MLEYNHEMKTKPAYNNVYSIAMLRHHTRDRYLQLKNPLHQHPFFTWLREG